MDASMKQLQEKLIEVEIEAENLLLARQQLVENDRVRNGNREALTALRRRAKTTKTSLPTPFESIMRAVESKPLVKELCPTCGNHDSKDTTWVMFPGTDVFANIPFHAAHTILEKDQIVLEYEAKKLQSLVKEKSFWISEQGVLADKISPGVLRSMVTLSDKPKAEQKPASRGLGGQEMITFGSAETRGSSACNASSSSGSDISVHNSSQPSVDAPLLHEGLSRTLSRRSPQIGSAATNSEDLSEASSAQVQSMHTSPNGISIFQGLIERVKRTVRGSADDIGWLQRAPHMPPVEDETERFVEILDDIRHGLHGLPNSVVYLLVPGLFSNHGPLYFVSTKTSFSKMGLTCHIAKIHSEASVEKNAREIKDYIEEIYWGSRKRVLLLGHSKGGVDAAASLSMYWTDLKDKVAGLVLAQSPYGGSPIASDILREGQLGDYVNVRKLMEILICKVIKGDMQALEDLTYERRKEFLGKYHLPRELPVVSFRTEASISPAVLATLSRVAHAEMPTFSAAQPATFPVVMPLGAVMAACAQLLQIRYGEKSDGLVTCRDAEVPGSVVVRPKRKLDHAWMVYSSLNDDPSEADASQVCEALLTLLVEVGKRKRHELSNKDE